MLHQQILFPHLHLTFSHVGKSVSIFGFEIAYYGIIIAIGMLLGGALVLRTARKAGVKEDDFLDVILWTLVIGVIGARIYYVIFSWDLYKDHILSVFNLRQGGLGIYGGILAGFATLVLVSKKKGIRIAAAADIGLVGVPLGQAIGRWGNFFNREAFGEYTDGLFAMWLPTDAVRSQSDITEQMWANLQDLDGVSFISVHPTFLYESLWNLALLALMLFLWPRKKFDGMILWVYFLGYGLGRMWIEPLRTDQLLLWGTKLPASEVLSMVLVVIALWRLIHGFRNPKLLPPYEPGRKPKE